MSENFFEYKPSIFSKVEINGVVNFEDVLNIEGDFNGTLNGKNHSNLIIEKGAKVEGSIFCYSVKIFGYFKGNIRAQKVEIEATGACKGEVTCSQLHVHDNAKMDCKIHTVWNAMNEDKSTPATAST